MNSVMHSIKVRLGVSAEQNDEAVPQVSRIRQHLGAAVDLQSRLNSFIGFYHTRPNVRRPSKLNNIAMIEA